MEKTYELSGHKLLVMFNHKMIQIKKPQALKKFLSEDIELRSEILVNYIKQDYFILIGKELEISNDSFIIEIWGHIFASHFAKAMKNLIRLKLIEDAANFIIKKSDVIDCGESDVDLNRKFWDILASFKKLIIAFLPKKIK